MCDPVTLTVVAIGATVLGGGITAYGQIQQGNAINAQSKYEAKIADRNAKITEQGKLDAARRGEREQLNHWRRVAQAAGQQRAEFAAGGLDVNFGTPAEVVEDTMMIGYEDSSIIASNTKKEIEGYDLEQANYRDAAVAARMRGKAAKQAGKIGAVGTLIGTVGKAASMGASSFGSTGGGGYSSSNYTPSGSYAGGNTRSWAPG
jgi:hypothetical protein